MDIDYNKLKIFTVAVGCGNLTTAAKQLFRTQSAISQSLSALERQLGIKLFTWEGKKLQLTREGKLVYEASQKRLMALDEQLTAITSVSQEIGGCIEIGMLNDASTNVQELLFTHIAEFRTLYPSTTFKIHFKTSQQIEEALLHREIDLGFLINIESPNRFRSFQMATEEHIIAASATYLKNNGPIKSVLDVVSKDLIDIDEHFTCFSPWVLHHDKKAFELLEKKLPVLTVPDFRLIKNLVIANQGIAVLPKYLIADERINGSIIQLLPKLSALRVWVSALIERGKIERPCEEYFLKKINGDQIK